ncbi:hypothetical protein KC19_N027000 [Ceratodon purpureus]|nr:hypothetical protein KC19_N027000 [Ceratodon purpureus]
MEMKSSTFPKVVIDLAYHSNSNGTVDTVCQLGVETKDYRCVQELKTGPCPKCFGASVYTSCKTRHCFPFGNAIYVESSYLTQRQVCNIDSFFNKDNEQVRSPCVTEIHCVHLSLYLCPCVLLSHCLRKILVVSSEFMGRQREER